MLKELLQCAARAVEDPPLERGAAIALAEALERSPESVLEPLLEAGAALGRRGPGRETTVSRDVIPLTNLCRDRCAYCTFAVEPDSPRAKTYALDEVREISRTARRTRCLEALFCLGDKPEIAYHSHRRWLAQRGYKSTAEYLVDA